MTALRQEYVNQSLNLFTFQVFDNSIDGLTNLLALELQPSTRVGLFVTVVAYLLGAVTSGLGHDPDKQFEDAYWRMKRAARSMDNQNRRYESRKDALRAKRDANIGNLKKLRALAVEQAAIARTELFQLEAYYASAKGTMASHVKQRIYAYEAGALSASVAAGIPLRRNIESGFLKEALWKPEVAPGAESDDQEANSGEGKANVIPLRGGV